MRYLKSLLSLLVFLSLVILPLSTATAQGRLYLNENFEGFGWWESGIWARGTVTDPGWAPDTAKLGGSAAGKFEFGPNRNKWYSGEWSAYASRRSATHPVAPSNYESTYVAGVHTYMDKRGITLVGTSNPIVLTFDYYMNLIRTFPIGGSDSFYVAIKPLGAPGWTKIFGGTGDSSKWSSARVVLGTYLNTTVNQIIDLRFGFVGRNVPPVLPGGRPGIEAQRGYGVWFDNVKLEEVVTLDVYATSIKLRNGLSSPAQFITDPVKCENFIPWVTAGATNPSSGYPFTFNFTFYQGTTVIASGTRTQASATDVEWNPLGGSNTVALTYPSTSFRLVVSPPSGTIEVNSANNEATASFPVSDFNLGAVAVDNRYFPALKPNVKGDTVAFWLEKGYDTPLKVKINKLGGFNKSVTMSYQLIWGPYGVANPSQYVTGSFSPNPTTQDTAYLTLKGKEDLKFKDGFYTFKITALYTARSGGECTSTVYAAGLVPDDFMLVPVPTDTLFVESDTKSFTYPIIVWRFNKHNKPVTLRAYSDKVGTFVFTPNDNPARGGRPDTSTSILSVVHTNNLPVTLPNLGAHRYLLEGRDGTKMADTVLNVHVRQVPTFSLTVTPASKTIWKTEATTFTVNITRVNCPTAITFNSADIVVSPSIAGVTFTYSSGSVTGNSVTLNVQTTSATQPGTYTVTVKGVGCGGAKTATFTLLVNPNWDVTMNVREWNTFANNTNLKYGMNRSATNGFDPTLGEVLYSMPADPIVFGAAFVIDTSSGSPRFSQVDIRPLADNFKWKMHIQGRFPFRLLWYPARLPKTYNFVVKDAITNGAIFTKNLKEVVTTDTMKVDSAIIGDFAISGIWSLFLEMTPGFTKTTDVDNDIVNVIPKEFSVEQNFPNPFNPSTVIVYNLPKASPVKVDVYNSLGQRIKTLVNEVQDAGRRAVVWNASEVSSGIYFYKVQAGSFTETRKMILMK